MLLARQTTIQSGHTDFHPPPVVQFEIAGATANGVGPDVGRIVDSALGSARQRGAAFDSLTGADPAEAFRTLLDAMLSALGVTVHKTELRTHPITGAREYRVACDQAEAVRRAGELADTVLSAPPEFRPERDFESRFGELGVFVEQSRIDPDALAVRAAARRRGLPVRWLDQDPFNPPEPRRPFAYGLLQIGQGIRHRRVFGSLPMPVDVQPIDVLDRFTMMSALIGGDIPVPTQDLEFPNKNRLSRLERAAERLGYPVVLRPARRQPFADWLPDPSSDPIPVRNSDDLARAFDRMRNRARGLWIEAAVTGAVWRFIVIGGAVRSVHAVAGGKPFVGGHAADRFSGEIVAKVEAAAAVVGLTEYAGIEAAVADPQGPAEAGNFAVTDVFPDPRLTTTGDAGSGSARPLSRKLGDALVETLFPGGPSRIPIVAVTGTNGKTTTVRMLERILRRRFRRVGLAETDGVFVEGRSIDEKEASGVTGACHLLAEPDIDAAVLETARGDMLRRGTAFDACDVAVLLNVSDDHVGTDGIETLEQMARVKGLLLRRATGAVVVNADDPLCVGALEQAGDTRRVLVSPSGDAPAIREHLAKGGAAVLERSTSEGDEIVLAEGERRRVVAAYRDVPSTYGGRLRFNRQNACHAAAAAWAMGVELEAIRDGLIEFEPSSIMSPGRFNFFDGYPFTVLLDYAHNPAGVRGVLDFIETLSVPGTRRLVCMTVGSRHRAHIDDLAPALAAAFEHRELACRPDRIDRNPEYQDGDPATNMLSYFRRRLVDGGASSDAIRCHLDRAEALHAGLAAAKPGDLLVVLGHDEIAIPILQARKNEPRR